MGTSTNFDRVMAELRSINARLGKIDANLNLADYRPLIIFCLGVAPVLAVLLGILIGATHER